MKFQLAILLLIEFLVFNANMVYMFRCDSFLWLPFAILFCGVLSCAAYMIRSERRQEKRFIIWDDAGLYLDPRKYQQEIDNIQKKNAARIERLLADDREG